MLQEQPKTDLVLKNLGDTTYRNVLVEIKPQAKSP